MITKLGAGIEGVHFFFDIEKLKTFFFILIRDQNYQGRKISLFNNLYE